jgi:hypothetical protein
VAAKPIQEPFRRPKKGGMARSIHLAVPIALIYQAIAQVEIALPHSEIEKPGAWGTLGANLCRAFICSCYRLQNYRLPAATRLMAVNLQTLCWIDGNAQNRQNQYLEGTLGNRF